MSNEWASTDATMVIDPGLAESTPGGGPAPSEPRDNSLLAVVNVILGARRLIVVLSILGALMAGSLTLLSDRRYTSSTTFMPQSSAASTNPYSAIAAQFGLARMPTDPNSSPDFYVDLLRSRPILKSTVEREYQVVDEGGPRSVSLIRREGARSPSQALDRAMRRLAGRIDTKVSPKTGVITLAVTTDSPILSQQIASHMLELLNEFDRNIRQSQAAAERRMLEERSSEARANLNAAEGRLLDFLVRNRNYNNSPELNFQFERLSREVSSRQQLYITLAQSYEKARIDEIRDTPVITVIEPADLPARPNARWTVVKTFIGALVGCLLAIFVSFVRAVAVRNSRGRSRDEIEFQRLWRETARDLRRPWRLLGAR